MGRSILNLDYRRADVGFDFRIFSDFRRVAYDFQIWFFESATVEYGKGCATQNCGFRWFNF